jgi:hypothetical protein
MGRQTIAYGEELPALLAAQELNSAEGLTISKLDDAGNCAPLPT